MNHASTKQPTTPPPSSIKVAIIVPVYNVEEYIETCLQSLIKQTLKNIMIVCINDGSTDKSIDIVERYQKQDPRIHIIHQKNQGLGLARNTGIEYILQYNPEYIGFVDSDDYIHPTMYEKLYTQAIYHNADVSYCNVKLYNNVTHEENIWEYPTLHNECLTLKDYTDSLFYLKITTVWDSIYSFPLIKTYGIRFPSCIHEDTLWFIAVFTSAKKICHINEALYIYRQNRVGSIMSNIPHSDPKIRLEALLRNYLDCSQWLFAHNCATQHYSHICNFIIDTLSSYLQTFSYDNRLYCLEYIKKYFPYPIYTHLKSHFYKKKHHRYMESFFSVKNDLPRQRKTITICGFRFHVRFKNVS